MKAILYSRADGSVSIGRIATANGYVSGIARFVAAGESLERAIARVAEKGKPASAISWRVIDSEEMPGGDDAGNYDATFRDAFTDKGERVEVDMPKAREIHRGRLRVLREPLLKALDVDYVRADEINDRTEKARIAALKQALRDATDDPAIEAAKTPDELKAILPAALRKDARDGRD